MAHKAYRLRHVHTGLYYGPARWVQIIDPRTGQPAQIYSALSEVGKVYTSRRPRRMPSNPLDCLHVNNINWALIEPPRSATMIRPSGTGGRRGLPIVAVSHATRSMSMTDVGAITDWEIQEFDLPE